MPPISYRILHLFVHVLISASISPSTSAPSKIVKEFLSKNSNDVNDLEKYFMDHIQNDWNVLKKILNISDENLSILIYSILDQLIKSQQSMQPAQPSSSTLLSYFSARSPIKLTDSLMRINWELEFTQNYVSPLIKNVNETIANFRANLDQALKDAKIFGNLLEGEINQTLDMDSKYCENYLPR